MISLFYGLGAITAANLAMIHADSLERVVAALCAKHRKGHDQIVEMRRAEKSMRDVARDIVAEEAGK